MTENIQKIEEIQKIISDYIRPNLQSHGGDIDFHSFDEDSGIVKVALKGACAGCPFASETLRVQVERVLKELVGGINGVEKVEG